MPNFNTGLYNGIVDHAEEIYEFLSGSYMNAFENRLLDCGHEGIEIGPMQFVRILRYRRSEDAQRDLETIQAAMSANLGFCARNDAAVGFFIVSNDGEFSIYIAVEGLPAESVTRLMSGIVPDIAFKTGFLPATEVRRLSSYTGVISGDVHCTGIISNMVLQALTGRDGIVGILAVPMAPEEVSSYVDALDALHQRTNTLLNNDMTYTSHVRKINQRNYRFIPELDAHLKEMTDYYLNSGEDFWKTCIWFSCENKGSLSAVGNAIAGILNGSNDSFDKARVFYTTDNPLRHGRLSIPTALFGKHEFQYNDILRKPSLISYVSRSHLASILQLPTTQVNGIDVIELSKTERSLRLFDVNHSNQHGEIELGKVTDSGSKYTISLQDLTEHVLVTGATGTGKTNTVFNLIRGIHSSGIPVLIIEPSKKDYWHLASDFQDMRIFSYGQDAELLRINPLIPEEGVIIGNHIDSLLYAFSGAFEMEEPTRLALDGLLKYAYEQFDWKTSDVSFCADKPFPAINDLLVFLPDYCKTHLPYGDEVRNNIYGSLVNRLSSLNTGMIGESVNASRVIAGKDLCSGTVLVELDDLSLETKPFIAMILMIKVDQYLRQGDSSRRLKNVVVLEEAHNIFASTTSEKHKDSREKASQYFSNMLSQIRGYGTGIIIADQGPSQINDMAISNTKVKIIHGIVSSEDMEKVAFALNLTDYQKRAFPSLQTGEAIVTIRGARNVNRVRINRFRVSATGNIACLFCDEKKHCSRFNTEEIKALPRMSLYAQQVFQNRYNPVGLAKTLHSVATFIKWPQEQELCLLGYLLSENSLSCGEREKRRIIQRYLQIR